MYKNEELQPEGASIVYWIHRPIHTDITKQGYVGITSQKARTRWVDHKGASRRDVKGKCDVLANAIRKYPDIIYEIVLVANTREYCERIENLLRPRNKIGWNIARGGMPVDTMMGGIANKERWIKYWKDNPTKAADKWWKAEQIILNKQERQRKRELADPTPPHTRERKHSARNTSGITGVTWFKKYSMWRAQLGINSKAMTLGYFKTTEEAQDAYQYGVKVRNGYKRGEYCLKTAIEMLRGFRLARK
jgi:hypothetical protein